MSGTQIDVDVTRLPAHYAGWYDTYLQKIESASHTLERICGKPLPSIRSHLLRDSDFGAAAQRLGSGYEVSLNAALPAILHFTFNCMLRARRFMAGVGDATTEEPYRDSSTHIPLQLPQNLQIEKAIAAIAGLSRPNDMRRAATAVLLTELAVAFCTYHELAHIVLGHVDANHKMRGQVRLLEVTTRQSESTSVEPAGPLRLVWEYEADLVAANMLFQDMLSIESEAVFVDVFGANTDCSVLTRVEIMLTALLVTFLLVAQAASRRRRTHPNPLVRFASIANDSAAALVEQQPHLQLGFEEMEQAVNDVATEVLSTWKIFGLATHRAHPLKTLLTARSVVESLERDRQALHSHHSGLAIFYPFNT